MYTYIIESQGLYKIGKAKDIEVRLKAYDTHNPNYTLLKVYHGDYELWLQRKYHKNKVKGEWYSMSQEEVIEICDIKFPNGVEPIVYKEKIKGRAMTTEEINEEIRILKIERKNRKILDKITMHEMQNIKI